MHGVRNSSWNPILLAFSNKNSDLRMRKREREREIEKKGTDEIQYTNLCCVILLCLMLLSLSVPLFFLLSMSLLCVCTYSLFVSLSFFFSSFLYLCVPLSNYKEIPKKLFLILLSINQIIKQFSSIFLHNS